MGCPTQCLAEFCLISILTKLGLTRRCSRRLAGLFPPFPMIKMLQETASLLGLKELKSGEDFAWFDFDGKLLELLAKSPLPQYDRRRVSFAFEVDDIHLARVELINRGVEAVTKIEGGPQARQYWAYFRDAEDNLFELVQRLS